MKRTFAALLTFFYFLFTNINPAYAQATGCSMTISPTLVKEGGSITINAIGIRIDDQSQTTHGARDFYLTPVGTGIKYWIQQGELNNGSLNITLQDDNFGNDFLGSSGVYRIELVRAPAGELQLGDFAVCSSGQQVTVEGDNSEEICTSTNILPSNSEPAGAVFTLQALGCDPGNIYRVNIIGENGTAIFNYTVQASNIGEVSQDIQGLAEGSYEVRFFNASSPTEVFADFIQVTKSQTSISYQCGQAVPPQTPTCSSGQTTSCCPTQCPSENRFAEGSGTGNSQQMCSCGREGERECPSDNALNLPACGPFLTPNANGICELANDEGEGINVYRCGEEVYPEDIKSGLYRCVAGCEPRSLGGGRIWCGCGTEGATCCSEPPTDTSETNYIGTPGCEGNLVCRGNICMIPVNAEGTASQVARGCSGGIGQVNTAIGCIPFDAINNTTRFFLAWGLSIGGGVALLLIGISGIMFATSSGIPQKVESAKSLFWAAVTGLAMLVLSVFLLRAIGVDILGLFS